MKKIITCGAITLGLLGAVSPAAFADSDGSGVNAASNWNFSAAAICTQETAVVPDLGDDAGPAGPCSNGHVIDHPAG
ncbi:hypothetical protein ACIPMU_39110 [Streptomyces cyaneofuscatus]|uniref:hypothetical protein n=1 Tax=Streptomyces cyaneofuscatus TaxID=66883 RepID=UPI003800F8D3